MENPLFSIITITYNAAEVLESTLESFKIQNFKGFEIIIVDGASSDNSVELAKRSSLDNMTIISEPDKGIYDAMNKGLRAAKGKYLLYINAGDALYSKSTLDELSKLLKQRDADIIYGETMLVNAQGEEIRMRDLSAPAKLTPRSFMWGMLVCHQAFAVKREIATEYDLQYRFSADYDWCIRCLKKSKDTYASGIIIAKYLTGGTTEKNHKASLIERFKIMGKHYTMFMAVIMHILFIPRYLYNKHK